MGRPSLATERKALIIEALAAVVREEGYDAATLERVAAKAEVQRTLIRHYFGNRDELIGEAIVHITGKYLQDYRAAMAGLPASRSLEGLVDHLFGGAFNQRQDDDEVIDALIAASNRSEVARSAIVRMYRTFEETLRALLESAFGSGSTQAIQDAAYALVCLAEHHAMMRSLGLGEAREAGLKRAALAMVRSMSTPKPFRRERKPA